MFTYTLPFPQKIHARKTLSTLIQDVQETHIKMFLYDDAMHLLRIFHIISMCLVSDTPKHGGTPKKKNALNGYHLAIAPIFDLPLMIYDSYTSTIPCFLSHMLND